MEKWAAELSQQNINKISSLDRLHGRLDSSQNQSEEKRQPDWIIYCDGAWGFTGVGAVAIITSPSGVKMRYAARFEFQCTNNIAEYEAVLLGLRKERAMGIQGLIIKIDSQVVAGHNEKDYKARDPELAKYLQFLREQEKYFEGFTFKNISRTDNSRCLLSSINSCLYQGKA